MQFPVGPCASSILSVRVCIYNAKVSVHPSPSPASQPQFVLYICASVSVS